jgi:hypothetical protein
MPTTAAQAPKPLPETPSPEGSLTVVGHSPLHMRGMNAGLAVWGEHAYVGSRRTAPMVTFTRGSSW